MNIIEQSKWLRIIQFKNKYLVQVRYMFKWHVVTFGPYGPLTIGVYKFTSLNIAREQFENCLQHKRSYALGGVQRKGFWVINWITYLMNMFTKKGRERNFFGDGLRNIMASKSPKKSNPIQTVKKATKKISNAASDLWKRHNILKRYRAKRFAISRVKFWQSGPKKSNYELMQLAQTTGLMQILKDAGVKTDWYQMKFLN